MHTPSTLPSPVAVLVLTGAWNADSHWGRALGTARHPQVLTPPPPAGLHLCRGVTHLTTPTSAAAGEAALPGSPGTRAQHLSACPPGAGTHLCDLKVLHQGGCKGHSAPVPPGPGKGFAEGRSCPPCPGRSSTFAARSLLHMLDLRCRNPHRQSWTPSLLSPYSLPKPLPLDTLHPGSPHHPPSHSAPAVDTLHPGPALPGTAAVGGRPCSPGLRAAQPVA